MKKLIAYWPAVLIGIVPFVGLAQDASTPQDAPTPQDASTLTGIANIIANAVDIFVGIFWAIAIAFALWTAISYMTAAGDETKIKSAKKRLIYTIIAFVIALSINLIKGLITSTLGGGTPTANW